ncbi:MULTISPECIES: branched-chain amino acid ABC transporter substrate-binding protein [unclassified Herbaspirillum]|jgi:branched-chain amino acid transport system substrate-binding protein|uniref:branched-chain amino acid ABC transporter substrate-binding protein n=1 Tax=unclassified Herbaspirillum TaxID=2624150 RepID=UPI000E2ED158|nr:MULTISPECIES: branched-chain amino acid ABC transporter substrate-binding protein [unclassified Herbaspirillum]RFB68021.1 branched-chain amino acid ABC transporter substrate-binding protein [Herbaspirillum sp. 3R-3a1]TFI06464.1 branched-chain amino acid ABC transporter substrate-binding protein [Herbaspirillum sp. 3R11]TFI13924.1 branched-chain amino acid ABC transporter substrate-binding protein [Herbaspirillum sp. 3R-11]TFI24889.1 branched-chain amino acid ABC transporter substrate-binding
MEKQGKRSMVLLAMAVLLGWQLPGLQSTAAAADKNVSIGFAGPLTGLSSASGVSMLNAVKMAVDEINGADLRVGGDRLVLKLQVQDDKSNPRIAEIAARYFAKNDTAGVVGIFNSAVAVSSSAIYQKAGIPHFAISGTRRFTQQGHDSAFRIAAYDEQRAAVLAAYVAQELHKSRVAIVHDDSVFGRDYKEKFESAFTKLGGKIVSVNSVSATTYDFNDILKAIRVGKADAVFFGGLGSQSAMLAQNMYRLGIEAQLVTAASLVGPMYLQTAGPGAEGTVSIMPGAHQRKSKQLEAFEKNYQQRYNAAPGAYSAVAYDQVQVLVAAIVRAGSANPRKVTAALHAIKHNGLTGAISFDAHGDLRDVSFSTYQVRNSVWTMYKQYHVGIGN